MNEVYYGVLFSLGGNIAITLGHHMKMFDKDIYDTSLTKLDHSKTRNIRRSYCCYNNNKCNRICLMKIFGHIFFFGGSIASAYALAYAPQTLLACIGSIQFVTNLLCSKIFHSKSIKFINIIGTLAVIIGCLCIVFGFSAHGQVIEPPTISDLFLNYNTDQYTRYLVFVLIIASFTLICGCLCGTSSESSHLSKKKLSHLTSNGASWITIKSFDYYYTIISGVLYAICSAMPGTQSVVLGKTLAVITRSYMNDKLNLFDPIDWFNILFISIVVISWLATQIFWIYRCNESMKRFDPVFILPMNQVMWITFSTIAGGLYFHEFENASKMQWFALSAGLTINYYGLFKLVPESESKKKLSYADVSNMDLKRPNSFQNHKKNKKHKRHSIHTRNNISKDINSTNIKNNHQSSDMSSESTISTKSINSPNFKNTSELKKRNSVTKTGSPISSIDTKNGGGILSKTRKIPSIFTNFITNTYKSIKNTMSSNSSVKTPMLKNTNNTDEEQPLLTVTTSTNNDKNSDTENSENRTNGTTSVNSSGCNSIGNDTLTDSDIATILQNIDYNLHASLKPQQLNNLAALPEYIDNNITNSTNNINGDGNDCVLNMNLNMDTNMNMNVKNNNNIEYLSDNSDDSSSSTSSSVCLHVSPIMTSDSNIDCEFETGEKNSNINNNRQECENKNNSSCNNSAKLRRIK